MVDSDASSDPEKGRRKPNRLRCPGTSDERPLSLKKCATFAQALDDAATTCSERAVRAPEGRRRAAGTPRSSTNTAGPLKAAVVSAEIYGVTIRDSCSGVPVTQALLRPPVADPHLRARCRGAGSGKGCSPEWRPPRSPPCSPSRKPQRSRAPTDAGAEHFHQCPQHPATPAGTCTAASTATTRHRRRPRRPTRPRTRRSSRPPNPRGRPRPSLAWRSRWRPRPSLPCRSRSRPRPSLPWKSP